MSRALLRPIGKLLFVLSLFQASCTFLAPYDEVADQSVNHLAIHTETALAQADAGQLSQSESQQFFSESIGTVRAMKARASLKPKNTEEQEVLEALEERYQALADRGKPPRSSIATGLRATLLDLQQIQIAKKRSAGSGARLKKE